MQRRGFLILLGVTVILVVLAAIAATRTDRNVVRVAANERALPGFGPKLGELAWIRLTHGTTKINFAQIGGQWAEVEKGNYPANQGKIRQMLLALADLSLIEPKTERPDKFARIGLDDPSNGKSTQVTVQDRTGATIGELIVGSRKIDLAAALSFAALAVVKAPPEPGIIGFYREEAEEVHRWEEEDKQRTQPRSPSEEADEMCRRQREQEARLAPGAHRLAQELIDIVEGRGKGRDHGSYSDEPPGPPSPLARPFVIGWPRR